MNRPASAALVAQLDGSGSAREWAAIQELKKLDHFPRLLLERLRVASSWKVRASCVYHATPYARGDHDAFQLGVEAIFDKSRVVRYRACTLLAYAQNRDALGALKLALERFPQPKDADDFLAAIDAIESGNHDFFVDRDHSGQVTLTID